MRRWQRICALLSRPWLPCESCEPMSVVNEGPLPLPLPSSSLPPSLPPTLPLGSAWGARLGSPLNSPLSLHDCVVPDWSAPANVRALTTTRAGGVSGAGFATLNLKLGDDDVHHVTENRRRLSSLLPADPVWLRMLHGTTVVHVESTAPHGERPFGDAMVAHSSRLPCLVTTADCLPVFLCDVAGTCVGVAHAGWRGLCAGVIEQTVLQLRAAPHNLLAHLGPAIGPTRCSAASMGAATAQNPP